MAKDEKVLLIVEDSDEDFYTTKRALKKSGLANNIHRCKDGQEALNYLFHKAGYSDHTKYPTPNLILLDLNLPKVSGKQVLESLKAHQELKKIPVVVLTTSNDERDIEECYSNGVNSYMQKPVDIEKFMESIQRLKDFWFEIVLLPKKDAF